VRWLKKKKTEKKSRRIKETSKIFRQTVAGGTNEGTDGESKKKKKKKKKKEH